LLIVSNEATLCVVVFSANKFGRRGHLLRTLNGYLGVNRRLEDRFWFCELPLRDGEALDDCRREQSLDAHSSKRKVIASWAWEIAEPRGWLDIFYGEVILCFCCRRSNNRSPERQLGLGSFDACAPGLSCETGEVNLLRCREDVSVNHGEYFVVELTGEKLRSKKQSESQSIINQW